MTIKLFGGLAAAAVLIMGVATSAAFARDTDPHQQDVGSHHHDVMDWDAMDTNHDGKISAAEHAAHAKAMFDRIDTNHDGMITKDEIHAHMEAMRKERMGKMFDRMDTNHDGVISREEMQAAMHDMHRMHREHMMEMDGMMGDDAMEGDVMPPQPSK